MTFVFENLGHSSTEELVTSQVPLFGLEMEIEDVKSILTEQGPIQIGGLGDKSAIWVGNLGFMRDGSLRNNGCEIVTKPLSAENALKEVSNVHHKIVKFGPNRFSARTSTHVHVNMLSFTMEQVRMFLLLYAASESYFFSYCPDRAHNIHCVPLSQTMLPELFNCPIDTIISKWSKYTAFNMLPLNSLGTVEFRHLPGTNDLEVLQSWLEDISHLWYTAKTLHFSSLLAMLKSPKAVELLGKHLKMPLDETTNLVDVKLAFI
jgi:hypothetical protein